MDRCHVTGRLKITNNLTFYARLLCAHPFRRTWASSFFVLKKKNFSYLHNKHSFPLLIFLFICRRQSTSRCIIEMISSDRASSSSSFHIFNELVLPPSFFCYFLLFFSFFLSFSLSECNCSYRIGVILNGAPPGGGCSIIAPYKDIERGGRINGLRFSL